MVGPVDKVLQGLERLTVTNNIRRKKKGNSRIRQGSCQSLQASESASFHSEHSSLNGSFNCQSFSAEDEKKIEKLFAKAIFETMGPVNEEFLQKMSARMTLHDKWNLIETHQLQLARQRNKDLNNLETSGSCLKAGSCDKQGYSPKNDDSISVDFRPSRWFLQQMRDNDKWWLDLKFQRALKVAFTSMPIQWIREFVEFSGSKFLIDGLEKLWSLNHSGTPFQITSGKITLCDRMENVLHKESLNHSDPQLSIACEAELLKAIRSFSNNIFGLEHIINDQFFLQSLARFIPVSYDFKEKLYAIGQIPLEIFTVLCYHSSKEKFENTAYNVYEAMNILNDEWSDNRFESLLRSFVREYNRRNMVAEILRDIIDKYLETVLMLINGILENIGSMKLRLYIRSQVYRGPFRRIIEKIQMHNHTDCPKRIGKFATSFMNFLEEDRMIYEKSWLEGSSVTFNNLTSSSLNLIHDRFSNIPDFLREDYADCLLKFLDNLLLKADGFVPDFTLDGTDALLSILNTKHQQKDDFVSKDNLELEKELRKARESVNFYALKHESLKEQYSEELREINENFQMKLETLKSENAIKQDLIDSNQAEIESLQSQISQLKASIGHKYEQSRKDQPVSNISNISGKHQVKPNSILVSKTDETKSLKDDKDGDKSNICLESDLTVVLIPEHSENSDLAAIKKDLPRLEKNTNYEVFGIKNRASSLSVHFEGRKEPLVGTENGSEEIIATRHEDAFMPATTSPSIPAAPVFPPPFPKLLSKAKVVSNSWKVPLTPVKLRQFQWSKISQNEINPKSIWNFLNPEKWCEKVDFREIDRLFELQLLHNRNTCPGSNDSIAASDYTCKKALLESRDSKNIEISLIGTKKSLDELMNSLSQLDDETAAIFSLQFCRQLLAVAEKSDFNQVLESLGKCSPGGRGLDNPEQFFVTLNESFKNDWIARLQFLELRHTFIDECQELRQQIMPINTTIDAILGSKSLPMVLEFILFLGNYLNQESSRGNAVGFHMEGLTVLKLSKTTVPDFSMLNYMVELMLEKSEEFKLPSRGRQLYESTKKTDLSDSLANLSNSLQFDSIISSMLGDKVEEAQASSNLADIAKSMIKIAESVERMARIVSKILYDKNHSLNAKSSAQIFLESAQKELRDLEEKFQKANDGFLRLLEYFAENVKSYTNKQFFEILCEFKKDLEMARLTNKKRVVDAIEQQKRASKSYSAGRSLRTWSVTAGSEQRGIVDSVLKTLRQGADESGTISPMQKSNITSPSTSNRVSPLKSRKSA